MRVLQAFWDWAAKGVPLYNMHGGNVAFSNNVDPQIWLIDWDGNETPSTANVRVRFNAATNKLSKVYPASSMRAYQGKLLTTSRMPRPGGSFMSPSKP